MHLCQHSEEHLDHEAEVSHSEPGHRPVAKLHRYILRCLVYASFVLLFLFMVLVVAHLLLFQIFFIFVLQLLLLLAHHHLKEAEGRRQVLQVLLDELKLVYVFQNVVVPLAQ